MRGRTAGLLALLLVCRAPDLVAQVRTTDQPDCADHPLVSRFTGAVIQNCRRLKFDDYLVPTRRPTARTLSPVDGVAAPGKVTSLVYLTPPRVTTAEVMANYRSALRQAGFESLFECAGNAACGALASGAAAPVQRYWSTLSSGPFFSPTDGRFIAARLRRTTGDVYVVVLTVQSTGDSRYESQRSVLVEIVEQQPVELGQVTINAAALQAALARDGKVALYGLYFDTDKAVVKPESRPQLVEIAAMLSAQPTLRVLVVGHTDGIGELSYNQSLSQRRADAVVATLITDFRIAAARLTPIGVGMASPVANNDSDDGRSRNRRVEIVARVTPGRQ